MRATEAARTSGIREGVAEMGRHADELEARLGEQQGSLTALGATLRFRVPELSATPAAAADDPAPALRRVAQAIDLADDRSRRAAGRAERAALLPNARPGTRALLVYGLAALACLLVQFWILWPDGEADVLVVIGLVPLVAYLAALLLLSAVGRPRAGTGRESLSPRLGFLLCFGVGPVVVILLILRSFLSR